MVKTSPSSEGGAGSIPGWGAKIPHASRTKNQNIKQKQYCNKFSKDFKNGPHPLVLFYVLVLWPRDMWEISLMLCVRLEGWDREGGRETQEGGDMGIYVYV